MLAGELTKARERHKMSQYDLAKFSGEQWNTIQKMEAGGKFMAHHFVWLKRLGVNLNILIGDIDNRLKDEVPGYSEGSIEQKESYNSQIEEPEEDNSEGGEDLSDLF